MTYVGVTKLFVRSEWRDTKIHAGYNITTVRKEDLLHFQSHYYNIPRYMYEIATLPPAFQTLISLIHELQIKVDESRECCIRFYDTPYADAHDRELDDALSQLRKLEDILGRYLLGRDEAIRRRGPLLAFYEREA